LKNTRRHIAQVASVALVSMMAFQGIGWFLAWQTMQFQAKYAAHKEMFRQGSPIRQLTISQTQYHASKAGKREIRLDGNLYDIRTRVFTNDSVRLELYHDWHEQALFSLLGAHFSNSSATPPLHFLIAKWLASPFVLPEPLSLPTLAWRPEKQCFHWKKTAIERPVGAPFVPPRRGTAQAV
jgi:hypothetical protein